MCVSCWKIYSYDKVKTHRLENPDHNESILTSKSFASLDRYLKLSKEFSKVFLVDGLKHYMNPYAKSEESLIRGGKLKLMGNKGITL